MPKRFVALSTLIGGLILLLWLSFGKAPLMGIGPGPGIATPRPMGDEQTTHADATPTPTYSPTSDPYSPALSVTTGLSVTAAVSGYLPIVISEPALPDLTVRNMHITLETGGACNFTSTELGVRVAFENIGTANAGPFVVDVNGAGQTVTSGLDMGRSDTLWYPGFVHYGDNVAVVDATFVVTESDESNNVLSQQLPVPTLPPTCTPEAAP